MTQRRAGQRLFNGFGNEVISDQSATITMTSITRVALVGSAILAVSCLIAISSYVKRTELLQNTQAVGSSLAYDDMYDTRPATWYFPGPSTSAPSTLGYTYGNAYYQSPGYTITPTNTGYAGYPYYTPYARGGPRSGLDSSSESRRLQTSTRQQSLADTDAIMQSVTHIVGPDGSIDGIFTLPLQPPPPQRVVLPPRPPRAAPLLPRGHGARALGWSYGGDGRGPHHWSTLRNWGLCGTGQHQSPINLELNIQREDNLDMLRWVGPSDSYGASVSPPALSNFFRVDGLRGTMKFRGDDYELDHLRIHTPSEHRWQGRVYPMEIQFMHKRKGSDALGLGVAAFVLPAPAANAAAAAAARPPSASVAIDGGGDPETPPALRGVMRAVRAYYATDVLITAAGPAAAAPPTRVMVPAALHPRRPAPVLVNTARLMSDVLGYAGNYANYLTYYGSDTAPPCSEGVNWVVLKTPLPLGRGDFDAVAGAQGATARPTQPVNGREVLDTATGQQFQTPQMPPAGA